RLRTLARMDWRTDSCGSSGDGPKPSSSNSRISGILFFRRIFDRVEAGCLEAEQIPRLQHMWRQRRGHVNSPAPRMGNRYAARQKMQTFLQSARQFPVFNLEIFWIANDRMVDMRH